MSAKRSGPRRVPHEAYAVCPPGLEQLCGAEIAELGVRAVKAERGGVSFRATTRQLYAANLWSRLATRVLVRVATFEATSFAELERQAAGTDLAPWLGGRAPQLRVAAHRAALYHTAAIAERLADAWGHLPEAAAERPPAAAGPATRAGAVAGTRADSDAGAAADAATNADDADADGAPLVVVRNVGNRFSVSVDCSGAPLYKRGWRREVAKAPLRENLAAALLRAVGWQPELALLDPFCGSGTIPIEAALIALGRPPGFGRSFALFDWPTFEAGTWASVTGEAAEREAQQSARLAASPGPGPGDGVSIVGADRDDGAVAAARANAERAEVADLVRFEARAVSATPPGAPRTGWVVTNPPYGARIDHGGDLRNLYARFGAVARGPLAGWSIAMLVADRRLAAHSGLSLRPIVRFANGGIDVELLGTTE